ncbi:hypothetical protein [Methylobacterium sp. WSM2598]|uniref:hypothetical protein n=1 Tax=Methylobacterium sp. WSM2598 TaxID=398261 RepID=UPI000377AB05|nr:hypothetical protein [Methylobacterium sp. WSM2598]
MRRRLGGPDRLTPRAARALAHGLLLAEGFETVARGARSGSLYLRAPGGPHQVRIADHARTPKRRRQYPDVVTSLVIAAPLSEAGVRARVAAALRAVAAARPPDQPV